jgi:hypothetical protein
MTKLLLPKVGVNPEKNLEQAIVFYKKNSPFRRKALWDWENMSWDVKDICNSSAGKATFNQVINFNRDNKKGAKIKTSKSDMEPFHTMSLSDVAKCHVTFSQIEKKKDYGTLQQLINAYRFLDNVMSKTAMEVQDLSIHQFKLAEQEAKESLAESTYYRAAQKLEVISKYLQKMKFTYQRVKFKKVAKRGEAHTNSDTRIDTKSVLLRNEKLPTKESLMAVAALSNKDMGDEKIYQSMVEIMFATGLRFDEVITLGIDCLKKKEVEERNVLTGCINKFKVLELTYKAKKGGGYRTKVIADSMVPILQKGINTAIEELQYVRNMIQGSLNGKYDFFPKLLDGRDDVFVTDVWESLGWSSRPNLSTYLTKLKVRVRQIKNPDTGKMSNRFSPKELKSKTLNFARVSAQNLWSQIKNQSASTALENMLYVTQFQENHSVKRSEPWNFQLITHGQLRDYISGRPTIDIKNVFERHNLMFQGKPIRLTSHQFRHFLDTIVELSDSVSDIEVARYFGRKYMGDNEAYDHTNKAKKVMDAADDIISSHGISKDQAKEASIIFTLVDREEALDTISDLTTTLVTSIGKCSHDFNDSPCGKHYACLRGCSEYYRTKNNKAEILELERIKKQQETHIKAAKEAVDEKYHGSNNWLLSHTELLDGCIKSLEIENNEEIPVGKKVQIFPDGDNGCEPI